VRPITLVEGLLKGPNENNHRRSRAALYGRRRDILNRELARYMIVCYVSRPGTSPRQAGFRPLFLSRCLRGSRAKAKANLFVPRGILLIHDKHVKRVSMGALVYVFALALSTFWPFPAVLQVASTPRAPKRIRLRFPAAASVVMAFCSMVTEFRRSESDRAFQLRKPTLALSDGGQ